MTLLFRYNVIIIVEMPIEYECYHTAGAIAEPNDTLQFQPPPNDNRYRITINQNYVVGSVIFQAQCGGVDTGTPNNVSHPNHEEHLIYGLISMENYFIINSTNGVISLNITAGELPGDGPFTAIVFCRFDNVGGSSTAELVVSYQIENEHVPQFSHGHPIIDIWVREDHVDNYGTVVVDLNVTDDDLDPCNIVTFEILSGNDDRTFRIDSHDGVIELTRGLDYDSIPKYNLTVRATNTQCGTRLYSAQTFVCVYVEDINDEHPTFLEHLHNFTFVEAQSRPVNFVQLQCVDVDSPGTPIVYDEGFRTGENPFEINYQSGYISATQTLDYEQQTFYHLTFTCYSIHHPDVKDVAVVLINVVISSDLNFGLEL